MSGPGYVGIPGFIGIANSAINQLSGSAVRQAHAAETAQARAHVQHRDVLQSYLQSSDRFRNVLRSDVREPLPEHIQRIKRMCDWLEANL